VSYDLMVFEASEAPRHRAAFDAWYRQQTRWSEGHSYDDPTVANGELLSCPRDPVRFGLGGTMPILPKR
jgi:hypothetical protein